MLIQFGSYQRTHMCLRTMSSELQQKILLSLCKGIRELRVETVTVIGDIDIVGH